MKMYCEKCGFLNEEGVNFCQNCGNPLNGQAQSAQRTPQFSYQQQYRQLAEKANYMVPGNAQDALRVRAGSGLFLALAITLSLQCVTQLISSIVGANQLIQTALRMVRMYGVDVPSEVYYILNSGRAGVGLSTAIGMIPALIMIAGIWMIFAAGKSKQPGGMGTAGLTMEKVLLIIQTVFLIISVALIEILLVIALTQVSGYGEIQALIIGVMIGLLLVFVFALTYYIKSINMLSVAKRIALTGQAEDCGSIYVGVVCFIASVLTLVGGFAGGAWGILSGFLGCAAYILFGVTIFGIRSDMKRCIMGIYVMKASGVGQSAGMYPENLGAAPQNAPQAPVAQESVSFAAQNTAAQFNYAAAPRMDTTVLSAFASQETTVLSHSPVPQTPAQPTAWISRIKDGNMVQINKPVFRMGKDLGNVDFFIGDNTAVSRHHADITYHDGSYFIRDNNSTNHVYLNEQQIAADTEVPLENHARILLADDAYEFTMQ